MASAPASMMPVTVKPVASPVSSVSLPPAPAGMNVAVPGNEIQDTQAVYLQDILLDQPGFARRRGPVTAVPGAATLANPPVGLSMTIDPQGTVSYGALTTAGSFSIWSASLASTVAVTWPFTPGTSPYPLFSSNAALQNGTMVGAATRYDANNPSEALAFWGGGRSANYTTGTISLTRGNATVTGSGTAFTGLTPGMWLFSNTDDPYTNALIGVVQSITNDTTLVLASPSPYTATGKAYTLQALRGVYPKVGTGAITCSTGSTQVNGGATKFSSQISAVGGSWNIYRASDLTWIGKISSVQSDISLTLAANAAISLADEAYVALRADGDYSLTITTDNQKPGFLSSVYAGRQWYANNGGSFDTVYRLWFSDPSDPEILDMTNDGNWIPINSTGDVQESIIGLGSAYNSLVVLKETEAFGVFGSDPTSFEVIKIADDGALSPMAVQQYGAGVLWAGREGIHMYDGTQDNNLTAAVFGTQWREMIESFNPTTHRMWSMIERDHYILYIEGIAPPLAVVKGSVSTTPNHWIVVVNLQTNAVGLWQNARFHGSVELPASQSREARFVYTDGTSGYLAEASAFFDDSGNDPEIEGVSNAGPDFYYVSKRIDGGSPTRLKRFTYFILNYLIQGDALEIDTVLGLNNLGITAASFPSTVPTWNTLQQDVSDWNALKQEFSTWSDIVSSVFSPDRVRFLKKSQFMQFRLWQASNNVTRFEIGDFELGFKPMRPGRI